jgi:hypothetical protein
MKIRECCVPIYRVSNNQEKKSLYRDKKSLQPKIGTTGKHPLVGVDGFEPPTLCL